MMSGKFNQPAQAATSPEGEGREVFEHWWQSHAGPKTVLAKGWAEAAWNAALRQSAAPSGGAIWCDSCGQDVTGESYRPHRYVICHKPGCADRYVKHSRNLDRRIDSPTLAQESKTGAVTETR